MAFFLLSLLVVTFSIVCFTMHRRPLPVPVEERQLLYGRCIFIAANYHNNAHILPVHFQQILRLISLIREAGGSVFVSIYENGSKDSTPAIIDSFRRTLRSCNVLHRILSEAVPNWKHFHHEHSTEERIKYMAEIRNRVLEPLSESTFDYVLFFNDVLFDAEDAIRLLLTEKLQYDAVCALDFNRVTFYDTWVSRDINGFALAPFYPYVDDRESALLVRQNRPFSVTSCWNGIIALKASALANVKFRSWRLEEPRTVDSNKAFVYNSECPISECALLFKDLAQNGFSKFLINPAVHVTYTHLDWALHWILGGFIDVLSDIFLEIGDHDRVQDFERIPSCDVKGSVSFRVFPGLFLIAVVAAASQALIFFFRRKRVAFSSYQKGQVTVEK